MSPPRAHATVDALRLLRSTKGQSLGTTPPRAPFGLASFDETARGVAVEVERDEALTTLIARLPHASELEAGAMIVVLGGGARGVFAKVIGTSHPLDRAVRGTALLACGYREIEAWADAGGDDLVIGLA